MELKEQGCYIIEKPPRCFVYFLLDENDDVVYVGQTKRGLIRATEHRDDKEYSKIALLPCCETELNLTESKYIEKYQPKYNKQHGKANCSMMNARNTIREHIGNDDYSMNDLKKDVDNLNIKPFVINLKACISASDVERIIKKHNIASVMNHGSF